MSRDGGLAARVIITGRAWQALEHRLCQLGAIDGRETKAKVSLHDKGESQQEKKTNTNEKHEIEDILNTAPIDTKANFTGKLSFV